MNSNKVFIGFGFHVNCYHSYRGDTNDKLGFGSDLRIIRNTIKTLDDFNNHGIKVKGTWDIENAYSLQQILPEYANDIITDLKRRISSSKDECILMSYNNGAQSAQNKEEFTASIKWAISNKDKSGLKDLFNTYAPLIRPQEVMMNPFDGKIYKECGIEGICLYHAVNSFDGYKNFISPIGIKDDYYPLKYVYEDSSIDIIPMISQMDLIDIGSLKYLSYLLHDKQMKGEINHDTLIFINMDADSFFWEKMPLPKFLTKKPNFGGLEGLINEVKDLPFIEFSSPYEFYKTHKPEREISFGEDVADGNFAGYASWAEKPFNRLIFTRLEKARALAKLSGKGDDKSASFATRVMLLSTTHFGLASPVLNITREKKALELSSKAIQEEKDLEIDEPLKLGVLSKSPYQAIQLSFKDQYLNDSSYLNIKLEGLEDYIFIPTEYYPSKCVKTGICYLKLNSFKDLSIAFEVTLRKEDKKEEKYLEKDTLSLEGISFPLTSYINYNGNKIPFKYVSTEAIKVSGHGKAYLVKGDITIDGALLQGNYSYIFFSCPFIKGKGLIGSVAYPYTKEDSQINSQASSLGRYTDKKWIEVAPIQIEAGNGKDIQIKKSNFRSEISNYFISDFVKANKSNSSRDSFNNQMTGGFLKAGELKISNLRLVASSMAFCPMRTVTSNDKTSLFINPFGTYYGKQPDYISLGNKCGQLIYSAMAPQVSSLAPSYNGAKETFSLFFSLSEKDEDLLGLSSGALLKGKDENVFNFNEDNSSFHAYSKTEVGEDSLKKVPSGGISKKEILHLVKLYFANQKHAKKELKRIIKEEK